MATGRRPASVGASAAADASSPVLTALSVLFSALLFLLRLLKILFTAAGSRVIRWLRDPAVHRQARNYMGIVSRVLGECTLALVFGILALYTEIGVLLGTSSCCRLL
jgi:hypothetical protein